MSPTSRWPSWGRAAILAVSVSSLSAVPVRRCSAQSRLWSPEERVLVTDFSHILAVAASPFTVFAATPRGLLVYDRLARRWRLPVTRLDGYPTSTVYSALADVAGDAVWLGLADGYARYDAGINRWEGASLGAAVGELMMDADNPAAGVWARTTRGWISLSRFGPGLPGVELPPPSRQIRSLSVEDALRRAPMADAMRGLFLTDARLRQHRFTAAALSRDQSDLFLGTDGAGLVRFDPRTAEWDVLAYGLPGARAGALARGPGGVWVATSRDGPVGDRGTGVTWVVEDLSVTDERSGRAGAVGGGTFTDARALVASGSALWLGSDAGLDRLDPASLVGRRVDLADEVFALAPAPGGVWAGGRRGVVRVTDDATEWVDGPAALALWRMADSLWLGTAAGLAVVAPGPGPRTVVPLPSGRGGPALAGPVTALSQAGDTLIAATPDEIAWRDPAGGAWTVVRPAAPLGRITCLTVDRDGVWVGGTAGLAHWTPATSRFVSLRVPGDLPAAVRDVAAGARYVWVATDAGLVRIERAAALGR